jgi:plastocyanin
MRKTSTRALFATAVCAVCTSCVATAPNASSPTAAAGANAPAAAAGANAPASAQPTGKEGNVVGTVVTKPWHAVKTGAVVYLEDGPPVARPPQSATMDNHDMAFTPMIAVVSVGGSVVFTNTDPLMHNVFTPDGEKWNLGEIPQYGSAFKRFDRAGAYTILCNLHPNMLAYVLVTPSTYFARTNADGLFALKNVPPGTYHVTAWAPRLQPETQVVTVSGGEVTTNFELGR